MGARRRVAAGAGALLLGLAAAAPAKVLLARNEALRRAFGEAAETRALDRFLSRGATAAAAEAMGEDLDSRMITVYEARVGDEVVGYGFFDSRVVRTLEGVFLVALDPEGAVAGVHVCSFYEPRSYIPGARWLAGLVGLDEPRELKVGRGVDGLSGATMSARAATRSVRRALALFEVLELGAREERRDRTP